MSEEKKYFKAFIRVVKSINDSYFGSENIIEERLIEAIDKEEVKKILVNKYPNFFQNGKIYERESKDQAQFFYVVIFPLYNSELSIIKENKPWTCATCNRIHENEYISKPIFSPHFNLKFCKEAPCFENYKRDNKPGFEGDETWFIKESNPIYIYKITEKVTNKCYIGKTKNEPVWRWWNHYKKSNSPFGKYLQSTPISNWTFEVIETLPNDTTDNIVFKIESDYIVKFDSIKNGFNTVISNKDSIEKTIKLFENLEE